MQRAVRFPRAAASLSNPQRTDGRTSPEARVVPEADVRAGEALRSAAIRERTISTDHRYLVRISTVDAMPTMSK
jgi:hypothetical protein